MGNDKQEQGLGLLVLGGLVGAAAVGVYAYTRHQKNEEARRWQAARRREEEARRLAEVEAEFQRLLDKAVRGYEAAVAERERQAAERERQAREAAAREAKAAEERREQHYRRREDARDRKFDAHEEGRSRIATDHVAQQSRVHERWFAEREAELEPLRQHANFLRDLGQPTSPAAPVSVPADEDPAVADTWAELSRLGKVGLDG